MQKLLVPQPPPPGVPRACGEGRIAVDDLERNGRLPELGLPCPAIHPWTALTVSSLRYSRPFAVGFSVWGRR